MSLKQRFLEKVNKTEKCWFWTASSRGNGYGCIKVDGKVIDAHRVSYLLFNGEIPEGKMICHVCDNRMCVNPDHLFLGTSKDNVDDAIKKGRRFQPEQKHPSKMSYERGCRCSECIAIELARRGVRKQRKNKK
jgi:hypothetical protein